MQSSRWSLACALAELIDVPVMIVHVSNRQAMEEIRRAQPRPTASIRARARS
jgi:dihydroorotase-like cyclic amidohydrolase